MTVQDWGSGLNVAKEVYDAKTLLELAGYAVIPESRIRRYRLTRAVSNGMFQYAKYPDDVVEYTKRQLFADLGRDLSVLIPVVGLPMSNMDATSFQVTLDVVMPE